MGIIIITYVCDYWLVFFLNIFLYFIKLKLLDLTEFKTIYECNLNFSTVTLILLEPKVMSLCHQYRARPPFTCLYCWLTIFLTLKNDTHYWTVLDMEDRLFHLRDSAGKELSFIIEKQNMWYIPGPGPGP